MLLLRRGRHSFGLVKTPARRGLLVGCDESKKVLKSDQISMFEMHCMVVCIAGLDIERQLAIVLF